VARKAGVVTTVLCLENTHNNAGGVAVLPERMAALGALAHRHGVSVHLDGARLLNAAAALGVPATRLTEDVDTVSLSLGKGLSAPCGALLAGARAVIDRARVNLRVIGAASLHKAGIFAAAGIVALKSMVYRLADDNRRARQLGTGLAALSGIHVDLDTVQTNIVLVDTVGPAADALLARLATRGVLGFRRSDTRIRFVTHRLIGDAEVSRAIAAVAASL